MRADQPVQIMVVEDEDPVAGVLEKTLAREGFEIRRAKGGSDALELLRAWTRP